MDYGIIFMLNKASELGLSLTIKLNGNGEVFMKLENENHAVEHIVKLETVNQRVSGAQFLADIFWICIDELTRLSGN